MASARLLLATTLLVATATPSLCVYTNDHLQGGFFHGSQSYQPSALLQATPQHSPQSNPFQVIFEWNALDYNLPRYPSSHIEAYDPLGSIFTGLEFTPDKYIVAVPRLYPGVPSTLNYIPRGAAGVVANPKLEPFPSAEWQSPTGKDGTFTTKNDKKGKISSPLMT